MAKEIYLKYEIVLQSSTGKVHIKAKDDYQVTTHEDGITAKEIKGWIHDEHLRYANTGFNPTEKVSVKRSRPSKDVERYTSHLKRGTLQTSIVKIEKSEEATEIPLDTQLDLAFG